MDMDLIRKLARLGSIPENLMVNKKTLVREEIKRKDGIYVYPMWIRREKPNANTITTTGITGATSMIGLKTAYASGNLANSKVPSIFFDLSVRKSLYIKCN